eukprot:5536075-Lingulodinium_polyedra.AAC.1
MSTTPLGLRLELSKLFGFATFCWSPVMLLGSRSLLTPAPPSMRARFTLRFERRYVTFLSTSVRRTLT